MKIENIKKLLNTKNFDFYNYKKVGSTMIEAKKKFNNKNLCILADEQINGKGRRGRKWISEKGNLYLSFLINYPLDIKYHFIFNAAITNSVCELIDHCCNVRSMIKWPNDILINNSKISGIISELYIKNKQKFIILGVGINIETSPEINNYPTVHSKIYNKINDRNYFAYKLIEIFFKQYNFILSGDFSNIVKYYKKKLLFLREIIMIEDDNNESIENL